MPAGTTIVRDLAGTGAGGDGDDRRDRRARVGDERLLAVDHPLAGGLVEHGLGAGAAGVAAAVGLGQPERAEGPPGAQVGQPRAAAAPRCRTGRSGWRRGPTPASSVMASDWSTRPSSSMATHSVVRSAPPPPYSSGNGQPEQPELAHRQHGVDREGVVAVPRLGVRRDLGLGEVADDLAERLLLVGQLEVHRRSRFPSLAPPRPGES